MKVNVNATAPAPATTRTEVMTLGEIRLEAASGDWLEVARIDGLDSHVYVWVDTTVYMAAMLNAFEPDANKTDVVYFDPGTGDWDVAFRAATQWATEVIIAATKAALG